MRRLRRKEWWIQLLLLPLQLQHSHQMFFFITHHPNWSPWPPIDPQHLEADEVHLRLLWQRRQSALLLCPMRFRYTFTLCCLSTHTESLSSRPPSPPHPFSWSPSIRLSNLPTLCSKSGYTLPLLLLKMRFCCPPLLCYAPLEPGVHKFGGT